MTNEELRIRVEELDAVAEHVPPAVLGHRLIAALEDCFGESSELVNIWDRFDGLSEEGLPPDGAATEVHRRTKAALESAERLAAHRLEEIGRLEDELRQERIRREGTTERRFDPGIPARAADRAAPERPDPTPPAQVEDDLRQFPDEPQAETEPEERAQGEIWKPCKACGDPKPLSEFPKNYTYKDGHTNKCKACTNAGRQVASRKGSGASHAGISHAERRLKAEATKMAEEEEIRKVTVLPPAVPVPEPEDIRPAPRTEKPERFCSNGEDCVAFRHTGRPTKLTHGNKERSCFGCQDAGVGEKPEHKTIVRHSPTTQEAS